MLPVEHFQRRSSWRKHPEDGCHTPLTSAHTWHCCFSVSADSNSLFHSDSHLNAFVTEIPQFKVYCPWVSRRNLTWCLLWTETWREEWLDALHSISTDYKESKGTNGHSISLMVPRQLQWEWVLTFEGQQVGALLISFLPLPRANASLEKMPARATLLAATANSSTETLYSSYLSFPCPVPNSGRAPALSF